MDRSFLLALFLWTLCLVRGQSPSTSVPVPDCPPGFEFQECGTACPQTCADVPRPRLRPCTLQCVRGCFCARGTVLRSENSSVCVTPSRCLERCLPVPTLSVPIKVLARGADFCSTQGSRITNFTRFLRRQIMRQYRANAGECRISDVEKTSCARHGRPQRLRSVITYTANLSCGDPCRRVQQNDRSSLQLYKETQDSLHVVHKERHSADVVYDGFSATISYFQGRKGARTITQKCSGQKTSRIREKVDMCTCPDTCPDVCTLPPVAGPCEAYFPRYFYNSTSGRCERFIYGGCRGNDNNFETLRECQTKCAPTTTSTPPTRPTRPTRPTPTTPSCSGDKVYTTCGSACPTTCANFRIPTACILLCVPGCFCPPGTVELGNSNRCVAQEECPNVCELPPSPGPCRAAIPRYFHNSTSGQCEQFIYGGCRGNDNNFETEEACTAQCINITTPTAPSCSGDKVYTTCGSACPTTCRNLQNPPFCITLCVPGCFCSNGTVELGTSDRCVAPEECRDICELPPSTGPCRAAIPRYFHNSTSGQCEQFIYGGCRGNDNNFETEESCIAHCITIEPTQEPPATTVGPPTTGPPTTGPPTPVTTEPQTEEPVVPSP